MINSRNLGEGILAEWNADTLELTLRRGTNFIRLGPEQQHALIQFLSDMGMRFSMNIIPPRKTIITPKQSPIHDTVLCSQCDAQIFFGTPHDCPLQ